MSTKKIIAICYIIHNFSLLLQPRLWLLVWTSFPKSAIREGEGSDRKFREILLTERESLEREIIVMVMDERLTADILATCDSIGYFDGDKYFKDPSAIGELKAIYCSFHFHWLHHLTLLCRKKNFCHRYNEVVWEWIVALFGWILVFEWVKQIESFTHLKCMWWK